MEIIVMLKEEYEKIALMVDKEIEVLTKSYSREERKWKLADNLTDMSQKEVEAVQASIRMLNNRKQFAKEAWLVEDKTLPPIIGRMLKPLIARRMWATSKLRDEEDACNTIVVKQSRMRDGSHFLFPERETGAYRNKHQKGFWSCKGCMPRRELPQAIDKADVTFYQDQQWADYWKQIQWCPNFLVLMASGRNPEQYMKTIRTISGGDVPICYGGLLHVEFQINPEEAKLIKFCDTCNFSSTEVKELAAPLPDSYEIGADVAMSDRGGAVAMIHCTCKLCGELIFEGPADEVVQRNSEGAPEPKPEYQQIMNLHYANKHPDEKEEE